IEAQQVRPRSFRDRDQPMRPVRGRPQQQSPKWQIEPTEVLRMTFMLQVVEYRHLTAGGEYGRRETGIEQNIQAIAGRFKGQNDLFPQDPRGTEARVDSLRFPVKV